MNKDDYEALTMKHEHMLLGVDGKNGMADTVTELHKWFLQSRGKNSVIMFIKDFLISGGIIAILVTWLINR